ncbi:MAG TPA: hypothetical protein VGC96_02700 [Candidatus Elarobacter sp.]
MRGLTIALLLAAIVCPSAPASAAAPAYATDGEATVYVQGAFEGPFDLIYDASIAPAPANRSWSLVGISLLGNPLPSDAVEIGLFRDPGVPGAASVYVSTTKAGEAPQVRNHGALCASPCRLELRGDARTVEARAGGRAIASWPRASLHLESPYVQLNGEVAREGDTIDARLTPVVTQAHDALPAPGCAFITRGIEVARTAAGALLYSGTYDRAGRAGYVSLRDGSVGESCPSPAT